MNLREAAKKALEALELTYSVTTEHCDSQWRAITALRAALAEPVLEPAPGYCKHCKQYTIEEPLPIVAEALCRAYETLLTHGEHQQTCNVFDLDDDGVHMPCSCGYASACNLARSAIADWDTTPPQRKPLTDAEIRRIYDTHKASVPLYHAIARAIERAHGIGGKE